MTLVLPTRLKIALSKNTMTLTNLKLNKKSETPNLQIMINRSVFSNSGSKICSQTQEHKKRKSSEIAATNLNIPQALNYGQHIHRSIPPELALENGRFWDFVTSAVKQLRVAW